MEQQTLQQPHSVAVAVAVAPVKQEDRDQEPVELAVLEGAIYLWREPQSPYTLQLVQSSRQVKTGETAQEPVTHQVVERGQVARSISSPKPAHSTRHESQRQAAVVGQKAQPALMHLRQQVEPAQPDVFT